MTFKDDDLGDENGGTCEVVLGIVATSSGLDKDSAKLSCSMASISLRGGGLNLDMVLGVSADLSFNAWLDLAWPIEVVFG